MANKAGPSTKASANQQRRQGLIEAGGPDVVKALTAALVRARAGVREWRAEQEAARAAQADGERERIHAMLRAQADLDQAQSAASELAEWDAAHETVERPVDHYDCYTLTTGGGTTVISYHDGTAPTLEVASAVFAAQSGRRAALMRQAIYRAREDRQAEAEQWTQQRQAMAGSRQPAPPVPPVQRVVWADVAAGKWA